MQITINLETSYLRQDELDNLRALAAALQPAPPRSCEFCGSVGAAPLTAAALVTNGLAATGDSERPEQVGNSTDIEDELPPPVRPEDEPAQPEGKPRRGRPKKAQDAPSAEPAATVPLVEFAPEVVAEFEQLIKRIEDLLREGNLDETSIAKSIKDCRDLGPSRLDDLRAIVQKNEKKLAEIKAARDKSDQIRQEKAASTAKPTLEELRASLKAFTDAKGVEQGGVLLNDYGCKRVSELLEKDPADIAEFQKLCAKGAAEKAASNA